LLGFPTVAGNWVKHFTQQTVYSTVAFYAHLPAAKAEDFDMPEFVIVPCNTDLNRPGAYGDIIAQFLAELGDREADLVLIIPTLLFRATEYLVEFLELCRKYDVVGRVQPMKLLTKRMPMLCTELPRLSLTLAKLPLKVAQEAEWGAHHKRIVLREAAEEGAQLSLVFQWRPGARLLTGLLEGRGCSIFPISQEQLHRWTIHVVPREVA